MEQFHDSDLLEAVDKATKIYNLCPNRVWAIVESSGIDEHELHKLFPPMDEKLDRLFHSTDSSIASDNRHDRCTFDFCEDSSLNSTAVAQRHELPHCAQNPCGPLNPEQFFASDSALINAAREKRPTAWHLYGRRIVQPYHKYMAISHVWSDGTGSVKGSWGVNQCLFDFFRDLAIKLDCDGLWWDTLCIPRDPVARSLAIQNMQMNYEQAEVTLVHDSFLRNLPWVDAETACLAILMSPWFSRGWTALELMKSHKVKFLFKGENGMCVLKDLRTDILHNPQTVRHKIASGIIRRLRTRKVQEVDDLLYVLRSRYTSFLKDMAVISALLVDVAMEPKDEMMTEREHDSAAVKSIRKIHQQQVFERVIKHIGRLEYGHLFHNLPTMFEGTSWCPTRLLSLPPTFLGQANLAFRDDATVNGNHIPPLQIDPDGNVVGIWRVFYTTEVSPEDCDWTGVHRLVAARIRASLKQAASHRILIEPTAKSVTRFLVVKMLREASNSKDCQFIGSVQFKRVRDIGENLGAVRTVVILNTPGRPSRERFTDNQIHQIRRKQVPQQSNQTVSTQIRRLSKLSEGDSSDQHRNPFSIYNNFRDAHPHPDLEHWVTFSKPPGQCQPTPWDSGLLFAAREGREEQVLQLLIKGADASFCREDGRTAMSFAAMHGHYKIVKMLLDAHQQRLDVMTYAGYLKDNFDEKPIPVPAWDPRRFQSKFDSSDKDGLTPLTWAVIRGHTSIVRELIRWHEINIDFQQRHRWTPLAFAVASGNHTVAKLLLDAGANMKTPICGNPSLLTIAVMTKNLAMADVLLDSGAEAEGSPARTEMMYNCDTGRDKGMWFPDSRPLCYAAKAGRREMVRLLIEGGANLGYFDDYGTVLHRAVWGGHVSTVKLLLKSKNKFHINKRAKYLNVTALDVAVRRGRTCAPIEPYARDDAPFIRTKTDYVYEEIVNLLLDAGACFPCSHSTARGNYPEGDCEQYNNTLHVPAANGDDVMLKLLLDTGKAEVNMRSDNSEAMTPLQYAARYGHLRVAELLLLHKADINVRSNPNDTGIVGRGTTLLHLSAERGHESVVRLLLEAKAEVNVQTNFDYSTPLHYAAREGFESIVRLLLNAGADANMRTIDPMETPLSLAQSNGHQNIVNMLRPQTSAINRMVVPVDEFRRFIQRNMD